MNNLDVFRSQPRDTKIKIHGRDAFEGMARAGQLASRALDMLVPHVKPGATTERLDDLVVEFASAHGAIPAPLNYRGFPKAICTSVNHVVCHGIPADKRLKPGDIINIDITVIKDGFHGDTSRMFCVGTPSIQAKRLVDVTYEAMWHGVRAVRPGAHLGDIGNTIQRYAEGHGFSIVREFCGHGIGRQFHEEPQVLHYGRPGTGLKLQAGMTFTIEPMINAGRPGIRSLADGWTIVTADHSLSAQWEHTVLVTPDGYDVLTVSAGAPAPPVPQH